MKTIPLLAAGCGLAVVLGVPARAQRGGAADTAKDNNVQTLVDRLDLEKYKNTIKGLAQFGDRRQGTKRNRDAVTWIETQLKQYGCQNIERITYQYTPAPPANNAGRGGGRGPITSPNGRGRAGNGPGVHPHWPQLGQQ